jgi:predicted kinase
LDNRLEAGIHYLMTWAQPFLIIVTGRPAAGKSTLAKWLAQELGLPVVSKDRIREILFGQLGWADREWARQLGRVSIDLIFYFAQTQLAAGQSIILDNAFDPKLSEPRFLELKEQTHAEIIQIICDATSATLYQRFIERAEKGNRHPGHGDSEVQDELWASLQRELAPHMDVGGKLIEVNTDDYSALDYPQILAQVKRYMNKSQRFRT